MDESYNGDNGGDVPTDPELRDAVNNAIKALAKAAGATIVPCRMPECSGFNSTLKHEAATTHRNLGSWPSKAAEYGAFLKQTLEAGDALSAEDVANVKQTRKDFVERIHAVFAENSLDILASPAHYQPAPELATPAHQPATGAIRSHRFTVPWNLSGHPTITIPCGMSSAGMPLTFQIVGKHLAEELLCQLGHMYEGVVREQHLPPLPPEL